MDLQDMIARREAAIAHLSDAIDLLGPVADQNGGLIREPILELIEEIEGVGEELKALELGVYTGQRMQPD